MIRFFNLLLMVLLSSSGTAVAQDAAAEREQISTDIDRWHQAASAADAEGVFSFMSDDAVYIGTDPAERWTKDEFVLFAAPYFEKGKGWTFTPISRQIVFSEGMDCAWFDEKLDTWMGPCFGSGVLTRMDGGWKLRHYHLAFTVPNARIRDVLDLLKGESR